MLAFERPSRLDKREKLLVQKFPGQFSELDSAFFEDTGDVEITATGDLSESSRTRAGGDCRAPRRCERRQACGLAIGRSIGLTMRRLLNSSARCGDGACVRPKRAPCLCFDCFCDAGGSGMTLSVPRRGRMGPSRRTPRGPRTGSLARKTRLGRARRPR